MKGKFVRMLMKGAVVSMIASRVWNFDNIWFWICVTTWAIALAFEFVEDGG